MKAIDNNKLPDLMPRVAKMLSVSGVTLADVVAELRNTDLSEYSIYVTIKGAAMCYPHVQAALDEAMPDTEPSPK
jgi:intergrase/recombinase